MGLDQTQPPFFPYPDIHWGDETVTVTRTYQEDAEVFIEVEMPPELARRMQAQVIGGPSIYGRDLTARVPDPDAPDEAFLRTWAANIADDAKERSQDA